MMFKNIKLSYAAMIIASFIALPSQAAETLKDSHTPSHLGYVKPGAAVSLTHDYDGHTGIAELETFTLTLEHLYSEGYLTVQLLNPSELQIHSDMNTRQIELEAGSTFSIPVQFSSAQAGDYYIGIDLTYENLKGEQSLRVLSVPVRVGKEQSPKSETPITKKTAVKMKKGIIALKAQEVIK